MSTPLNSINAVPPFNVADGGTGVNDLTPTHGVLYANGTGAVQVLPELSDGYLIIGNSGNPPNAAAVTSNASTIAIGGTAGGLNLDIQAPVNVAHGGTGFITATAYGTVVAGTTSTGAFTTVSPGTSGYVLTSNGSSSYPTYQALSGTGIVLEDYTEVIEAASTGSSYTINLANGNWQELTLTANCTFAFSNVPATSGQGVSLTLALIQDSTGSRTVTWPGSVDWGAAGAPTLTTTANDVDVIVLITANNGTRWRAMLSGKGFGG